MPEYLHPGVYVVEVDGGVRPIEGVSTSAARFVDEMLLRPLRALAERLAPGWTEPNDHDPGVVLLSLIAWISEATLYRTESVSDESAAAAAKLAAVALRALQDRELPDGSGIRKVRFYKHAVVSRDSSEQNSTYAVIRQP